MIKPLIYFIYFEGEWGWGCFGCSIFRYTYNQSL